MKRLFLFVLVAVITLGGVATTAFFYLFPSLPADRTDTLGIAEMIAPRGEPALRRTAGDPVSAPLKSPRDLALQLGPIEPQPVVVKAHETSASRVARKALNGLEAEACTRRAAMPA